MQSSSNAWMLPMAFGLGAVTFVIALQITRSRRKKQRVDEMRTAAARLRFEYREEGMAGYDQLFKAFPLFNKGHSHQVTNLLQRAERYPGVQLFDYQFITGHGKNRRMHFQTVIACECAAGVVAEFAVHPESGFDKIAGWFGGQDVDFPEHPEFSKRYRLRGEDESAIRREFTPALRRWFEAHPASALQTAGGRAIYYHPGLWADANALEQVLAEAEELFAMIRRHG